MVAARWHPGTLGLLWTADLLLLLILVPVNARAADVALALGLWLVPTSALLLATLRWWRHGRRRR